MSDEAFNPYLTARQLFGKAADMLSLDQATRELLCHALREFSFAIPVRMDDGKVKVFRGFRVQHNDARGPCKGGIRFHPQETLDAARAMAMWMTWKCAVVDIPLGGGEGGIICDPHGLSAGEQERLCRGWVKQLARNVGPLADVPAPDVMTNAQHMLWMLDEYESIFGAKYPGFITGKPVGMGGSQGRTESTGYGLVYVLREALKAERMRPEETTASVQGFGNVGQYFIELYQELGGKVVCVSCWDQKNQTTNAFVKKEGIDVEELRSLTDRFGEIDKTQASQCGYEVIPGDRWLDQEVDILIPAAMENQIRTGDVARISRRVSIIAEGANGPTSPEADQLIQKRDIKLIPDFLANAGGVICSYFEQVQCNMNYFWDRDEVLGKLDNKMTAAFYEASHLAKKKNLSLRDAAYLIAVNRVATACKERGWV